MRILYIHQFYASPRYGRAGTRSFDIARALVARSHQVVLYTSDAQLSDVPAAEQEAAEVGFQLRVVHSAYTNNLGLRPRVMAFARFTVAASWEALRGGYDMVYATSTPLSVGVPAILARILRRIPYVFEVRDLWPAVPVAAGVIREGGSIHRLAQRLERACYRWSEGVVALSEGMRTGVIGVDPGTRTIVVPNFARLGDEPGERPAWVNSLRDRHEMLLVYTGSFGWMNDLPSWLSLANRVADEVGAVVGWVFVGEGAARPEMIQRAGQCGLLDRVVHVRHAISPALVRGLLGVVDAGICSFRPVPAMEANSSNKFFDYLAAGLPIVMNYGGWQHELVMSHDVGVRVDPTVDSAETLLAFLYAGSKDSREERARTVAAKFRSEIGASRVASFIESRLVS
jgi:glycosyltransferase involved in cell wall biosynthesis